MNISLQVDLVITQELLDAILVTAFEGGINYWCSGAQQNNEEAIFGRDFNDSNFAFYVDQKHRFCYELYDTDSGDSFHNNVKGIGYTDLTIESLVKGIRKYIYHQNSMNEPINILAEGTWDVNDADMIVQFAVFGELVFG